MHTGFMNVALNKKPFQSKANGPLVNRSGDPQLSKFEQVWGHPLRTDRHD